MDLGQDRRADTQRLTAEERERIRDVDDESAHTREVYALFGLAIYYAQVLEHGIVNLLTLANVMNRQGTPRDFDEVMERRFRDQFAELVRRVEPFVGDDPNVVADLAVGVDRRNGLAHRYFRERAEHFMSWTGRRDMCAELRASAELFKDLDSRLTPVTLRLGGARGFTEEAIDAIYQQLKTSAQERDQRWMSIKSDEYPRPAARPRHSPIIGFSTRLCRATIVHRRLTEPGR